MVFGFQSYRIQKIVYRYGLENYDRHHDNLGKNLQISVYRPGQKVGSKQRGTHQFFYRKGAPMREGVRCSSKKVVRSSVGKLKPNEGAQIALIDTIQLTIFSFPSDVFRYLLLCFKKRN